MNRDRGPRSADQGGQPRDLALPAPRSADRDEQATDRDEQATDRALRVSELTVAYGSGSDENVVVRDVDLVIEPGRITALAGESGCGKSTLALAAIGYSAPGARVLAGRATLGGRDLSAMAPRERRRLWGSEIAFVAQSAGDAMNPAIRVGSQLAEVIRIHERPTAAQIAQRQLELLERVGIPDPRAALRRYPHEFSGGQLQRIAIAIAIACRPRILILDEPTTGLDVRTQRQISALISELVGEQGIGALYVSHDLALLSEVSTELYVMYAGRIVESGATREVLQRPMHPYTRALLDAAPSASTPRMLIGIPGRPPASAVQTGCAFAPRCRFAQDACRTSAIPLDHPQPGRATRCRRHRELTLAPTVAPLPAPRPGDGAQPVLSIRSLTCRYQRRGPDVVHDLSLAVHRGEAVGIVGESGSGKSTLLRAIAGLISPRAGEVLLNGARLAPRIESRARSEKRALQLIFQNPDSSLNPAHTAAEILSRPLQLFGDRRSQRERNARIAELLELVQLGSELAHRHPDELSGGQKQRLAIARAFAAEPEVLLCDEVTSALDVSVQATIVTLLTQLAQAQGVATIFVTHDLAVVRAVAARLVVMKDGEAVEEGSADAIFQRPQAAYTRELLASIPAMPAEADMDAAAPARPLPQEELSTWS
ncbi:MAG TPA: ABC transporter ATP-binding protein [Solirubrobacteraceae bacterium]|nr:ABC transporter ATP-binding protein [Solirubrobacteraceae bacterium]